MNIQKKIKKKNLMIKMYMEQKTVCFSTIWKYFY